MGCITNSEWKVKRIQKDLQTNFNYFLVLDIPYVLLVSKEGNYILGSSYNFKKEFFFEKLKNFFKNKKIVIRGINHEVFQNVVINNETYKKYLWSWIIFNLLEYLR